MPWTFQNYEFYSSVHSPSPPPSPQHTHRLPSEPGLGDISISLLLTDLETRPQSKLSTENQGVTEEIPNSALVERFLQESLWHSKDEGAAGHREQGPEKSDSCVVQAACTLVKTLTEEQQQGDGVWGKLEFEARSPNSTNDS